LLDVLVEAGGGPERPADLGAVVGIGHNARAKGLGELRREGLIEGTIHEVSLTAAGRELARRRQAAGGEDPRAAESLPPVPVADMPAAVSAADDSSSEDPDAQDLELVTRPPAPPGDRPVDVVRAVASLAPAHRSSPEDGASDVWGWLFVIAVPTAVILWLRSRGRAAGALRPIPAEGMSAAQAAAPPAGSLQAPSSIATLERVVRAERRRLDGRG